MQERQTELHCAQIEELQDCSEEGETKPIANETTVSGASLE